MKKVIIDPSAELVLLNDISNDKYYVGVYRNQNSKVIIVEDFMAERFCLMDNHFIVYSNKENASISKKELIVKTPCSWFEFDTRKEATDFFYKDDIIEAIKKEAQQKLERDFS